MLGRQQHRWRKALLRNSQRIQGILANKITLLVKLLQFQIPEVLAGGDALQVERHIASCNHHEQKIQKMSTF